MSAPTNTSWATATALGSLTASGTQRVDDAGTTYEVYYTWTADIDRVIGGWFFGDLTTYEPTTRVYTVSGGVGTPYPSADPIAAVNKPFQIEVTRGTVYGFKVTSNAGNPSPATVTWNVQAAPMLSIPVGSLLVNDDTDGFPAMTVDSSTGLVNGYVTSIVAGEHGDVTTAGTVLALENNVPSPATLVLYNAATLAVTHTVTPFASASALIVRRVYNASTFWAGWAGSGGTNAQAVSVGTDGTVGATTYTLAALGLTTMCVDSGQTTIFYSGSGGSLNSNIKRWDINSNSGLSDLVADFGGSYFVADMLMLGDDTLVVMYAQVSPDDVTIKRYNSTTGAALNTYAIGAEENGTSGKLATATDDPTSFWAWTHTATGTSKFRHVTAADGTIQTTLTVQEYEDGVYASTATATPTRFGISQSCPFLVTRVAISKLVPPPPSGTVRYTRRLRRFPLPFELNVYQFLSRLEVLVQSGVGLSTGQGSDPVIMCRISRDGGETWGYELTMGLGKQGQYSYRAYLNRLGRGRNFVVELTTSDPVFVAILAAYADLETGTA